MSSKNLSPMQLRSQMRQKLTHSGRDFVINDGHIDQQASRGFSPPRNNNSVIIDTSYEPEEAAIPRNHITPRIVAICALLATFQILCFLAWKFGQSPGNDL